MRELSVNMFFHCKILFTTDMFRADVNMYNCTTLHEYRQGTHLENIFMEHIFSMENEYTSHC